MKRMSLVADLHIYFVSVAAIVHIGDNVCIRPRSCSFSVERQPAVFWKNEGNFEKYRVFSAPIPLPPVIGQVSMSVDNLGSMIQAGRIRTLSLSSSSVIQVGNTRFIEAEFRAKEVLQRITEPGYSSSSDSPDSPDSSTSSGSAASTSPDHPNENK